MVGSIPDLKRFGFWSVFCFPGGFAAFCPASRSSVFYGRFPILREFLRGVLKLFLLQSGTSLPRICYVGSSYRSSHWCHWHLFCFGVVCDVWRRSGLGSACVICKQVSSIDKLCFVQSLLFVLLFVFCYSSSYAGLSYLWRGLALLILFLFFVVLVA